MIYIRSSAYKGVVGFEENVGRSTGVLKRSVADFWKFKRDADGSLTIFSLFLLVVMLIVGGTAVDTIRHETMRTKLQYTLDRAVLAAADLEQTLAPQDVVDDYFAKSGLPGHPVNVVVNDRRTRAASMPRLPDRQHAVHEYAGRQFDSGSRRERAGEGIMDLEISLGSGCFRLDELEQSPEPSEDRGQGICRRRSSR